MEFSLAPNNARSLPNYSNSSQALCQRLSSVSINVGFHASNHLAQVPMATRRSQSDARTASSISSHTACIGSTSFAENPHNPDHPPSSSLVLAPQPAGSDQFFNSSSSSSFLSLVTFNARSLVNKLGSLRSLVTSSNPDIILVTETWLTEEISIESTSIPDYNCFRNNRLTRRGGGCLAYVKQSLSAKLLQHPIFDIISDSIWVSIPLEHQELLIGCVYRPPSHQNDNMKPFIDVFNHIPDLPSYSTIIAGDFNAPRISWTSFTAPRKLLDFVSCVRAGRWTQHVTSPTRGNNCLDLLFTRNLSEAKVQVLDYFPGSDHKMVTCRFTALPRSVNVTSNHRSFRCTNWHKLTDVLRKLNWDNFFLTTNPQLAATVLYSNLNHALTLLSPADTLTVSTPTNLRCTQNCLHFVTPIINPVISHCFFVLIGSTDLSRSTQKADYDSRS
ncbi:endonuclease/exonuclease/phosphatase family protein [Streptococcus dysgalactiae subsp. equisimilis]|nr:endonuclease/exonuclease/phosphatase family protein [Streptococcus dysgalactiae subsp. equisimilis]